MIPLDQPFFIGYAINENDAILSFYSKHQVAGSVMVTLPSNGEPAWGELVKAEPVDNVSPFEAIISTIEDLFESDGAYASISAATAIMLVTASTTF